MIHFSLCFRIQGRYRIQTEEQAFSVNQKCCNAFTAFMLHQLDYVIIKLKIKLQATTFARVSLFEMTNFRLYYMYIFIWT